MQETPQQYTQRILGYVEATDALKLQRATAAKLAKFIKGLNKKQLTWKPDAKAWSITEILAHLADAEIVASWRLRLILGANTTPIAAFDQDAWATTFQYSKSDPQWSIEIFRLLRENNLRMLKAIPKPLWENYGIHSERGKESIAHIVRMFAGHDTNHIRQIEEIRKQVREGKRRLAA